MKARNLLATGTTPALADDGVEQFLTAYRCPISSLVEAAYQVDPTPEACGPVS